MLHPEDKLATAGSKEARELEKVKQTFEKVYREAGNAQATKNTADGGGVKYSLSQQTAQSELTKAYQNMVDQVLAGNYNKSDPVLMGYTPSVYQNLGMPSLPFVVGPGHIYSIAKTAVEAKNENRYSKNVNYHGLGTNSVKNILGKVADPVMVLASKDVQANAVPLRSRHSVVAIVDIGYNGKSLLAPIEITAERTMNGGQYDVNLLSSVYEKTANNLVTEAIAQENIGEVGVFYISKKASALLADGVQFPKRLTDALASDGIVHQFAEKVNMNVMEATQSQQFKRWFGDWQNAPEKASKIINEDGTPRVVYHGTNGNFNVFQSDSGAYWFSESYDYAESMMEERGGGEVKSAYLNIRNPYYAELEPGKFSDPSAEAPIIRKAQAEGYDGVIIKNTSNDPLVSDTFYVAFEPTQIKSSTDNIGTFDGNNPDIRYSLSPEGEGGGGETGGYNVYGEDIRRLDGNDLAPAPETGPLTGDEIAPTMEEIARQEAEKVKSQAPSDPSR